MRRYVFVTLLIISSVSFGSSLNFDSDTGVSFNFDMGQFNIFVGYRYSGFDYLLNYNSWLLLENSVQIGKGENESSYEKNAS